VEIVLGVSMTPTTVSIALVEGEKADGVIVERDVFDITETDDSATSNASDHVIAAVLGTQEGAIAAGHYLVSTGVTWTDHAQAAVLRDALVARGIEGVLLVSELHAAAALAQAVGRAVGYDKTALMFVERDTATLAVVETADGSVVKVLSQGLHSADTVAVLAEMVTSLQAEKSMPQGMFVVGSNVDVTAVKAHLKDLVSVPVIAPEEPQLALARGAALASANAPRFDASTVGLAYSLDPDETTGYPLALADDVTACLGPADSFLDTAHIASDSAAVSERSKPFLLVGSSLTAVFVAGMMALAIALVINIRPTMDQGPGEMTLRPEAVAPPTALQPPPAAAPQQVVPAPAPTAPPAPIESARLKVLPAPPPHVVVRNAAPAPAPPPAAPPPVVLPPGIPPPLIPWLPPILQPPPYYYNPQLGPQWYPGPKPPWGRGGGKHGHGGDEGD
jgi:hypothetical protein